MGLQQLLESKIPTIIKNTNVSALYQSKVAFVAAAPKGTVISKTASSNIGKPPFILPAPFNMLFPAPTTSKPGTQLFPNTAPAATGTVQLPGPKTGTLPPFVLPAPFNLLFPAPTADKPGTQLFPNIAPDSPGAPRITIPKIELPDVLGGLGDMKNLLIYGGIAVVGIIALSFLIKRN